MVAGGGRVRGHGGSGGRDGIGGGRGGVDCSGGGHDMAAAVAVAAAMTSAAVVAAAVAPGEGVANRAGIDGPAFGSQIGNQTSAVASQFFFIYLILRSEACAGSCSTGGLFLL